MIATALFLLLAGAAPSRNVQFERLEGNRVRVAIVFSGGSFLSHTRAQLQLLKAAERLCGGPGRARSAGTLNLDNVERHDPARRRGNLKLSEEYACTGR